MTLADLASIGSLVSGVAVLVSLVYLSLQVRQTEKNQRALMNQGVATRAMERIAWIAEPDISDLFTRTVLGESDFSAQELMRLAVMLRVMLISGQDVYTQQRSGLLDQIMFDATMGGVKFWLSQPAFRAIWKSGRLSYAPEWRSYIDALIEETPLAQPVDTVAEFKANLAEVLR
jgi:hypothetical protein